MKLEDKFLEQLCEHFINEKPQWLVKAAHDLAEIKLKADKDKIIKAIMQFQNELTFTTLYEYYGLLAIAILESLEVEE